MTYRQLRAAARLCAAGAVASCAFAGSALASSSDYVFEPVKAEARNEAAADIAVRLIHKPTGKPVAGAILFRTRLDMSPDDMAGMEAKLESVPSSEPGVYRFKADFDMAGRWALKIMAKVPGETETVEASVIFTAKD